MQNSKETSLLQALGPGLIWAGTSIGVSHLVQSTRAGAGFSLALLWLVVLANVFKYPAFQTGPRYAAATGVSLLEGYRRLGTPVIWLFLALTVCTMFTVLAGVTIVTAGMATALVTDQVPVWAWSGLLLVASAILLAVGRFWLLETFMKVMMGVLAVSTVASVLLLLPGLDWSSYVVAPLWPSLDKGELLFMAALAGWMPSAIDIAVWQSLWGLEKQRSEGIELTPRGAAFDFNVGYIGTAILACLFVFLGATVLHGEVSDIPQSGAAFAALLVDVYAAALGDWARPIILVAAFSTMLSTTVAVSDGFPRAVEAAVRRLQGPEETLEDRSAIYWVMLGVCGVVAFGIIGLYANHLRSLVDLATTLTGLTAPMLAIMNLMVMRSDDVPVEERLKPWEVGFHVAGIVFLFAMAAAYLVARFVLQG